MPARHSAVDPDGLLEYSVVFTSRSLNQLSRRFGRTMRRLSALLRERYKAHAMAVVPGGGTFAMEAAARCFAADARCLVLRNGWFGYRWNQILSMGSIPQEVRVLKARPVSSADRAPWAPPEADCVEREILAFQPDVVFTAHVETSAGLMLPDDYLRRAGKAARAAGALFVVDAIASGCAWLDMEALGIDVLITAPQKGWSASPCAGVALLSQRAKERVEAASSTSFAADLGAWLRVSEAFDQGGHIYHSTLPTDALRVFAKRVEETRDFGYDLARSRQFELGSRARALLAAHGFQDVAAPPYQAPGVVVSYTSDPEIQNGARFADAGVQVAAGIPLRLGEGVDFKTFRVGLFGLDKLSDVEATMEELGKALERIRDR